MRAPEALHYAPEVFDVHNEDEAKKIILTSGAEDTNERWKKETPYVAQDIGKFIEPKEHTLILDYGCGLGRIAKELISNYNCYVLGVDISTSMRQLSPGYVNHPNFSVCSKESFIIMLQRGFKVDAAYSLWVLQHCPNVQQDIQLIYNALNFKGQFYLLNCKHRALPTNKGWTDDGEDILTTISEYFELHKEYKLPAKVVSKDLRSNSFVGHFTRKSN